MNKYFYYCSWWCLWLLPILAQAQAPKKGNYQLLASKTKEKITLDGELNEAIWQTAQKARDFYQTFPFDTSYANAKTEAMVTYDDQFFYVAFICEDKQPDNFVVQSLRRDFNGGRNDFVTFYLDPFGDGTNGFTFGITPLGVKREALIANGESLDPSWDNKWYSKVKRYPDKWIAEMAIPFKTLRYKSGTAPWKINFARLDYKTNERSSWVPVPRAYRLTSLAFTGTINWEEPLPKSGANIVLIPYVTGGFTKEFDPDNLPIDYTRNAGMDAKIAITSSLNLDLTFNPDFSQVEVDRQVTNLSRFELFFPERRQFFIENSDLFSRFGFGRMRPFFSRRIGIQTDTATGENVQVPILYGARLSGKLNKDWRIGLLNMQTDRDRARNLASSNYTVAVLQRKVFARSNVGLIFVNQQTTSDSTNDYSWGINDYDRVMGFDYNMASKDNKWTGKMLYQHQFTPEQKAEPFAHGSEIGYNTPEWQFYLSHESVGRDYAPRVGFAPRPGYFMVEGNLTRRFYPKQAKPMINNHGPGIYGNVFWDMNFNVTDRFVELQYGINFQDRSRLEFFQGNWYTKLFDDFDPTNTDGVPLLAGTEYFYSNVFVFYNSNPVSLFNLRAGAGYFFKYFNGKRTRLTGEVSYRFQPYGRIAVRADYNQIALPAPYNSADLLLIAPRLEFSFTRKLFFTLFTQYNTQANLVNVNARFQWRFKPVSDLFIVYTDNYFSDNFQPIGRSLVVKLTYWLNL